GDCNGDLAVKASDIARTIQTILRCGPCTGGIPGGVSTGCAGFANGCPAADFNPMDSCIRAGELAKIIQNVLRTPALQTPGAACGGASSTPTSMVPTITPTPTNTP